MPDISVRQFTHIRPVPSVRLLALFFCLVLALGLLSGCSGDEENGSANQTGSSANAGNTGKAGNAGEAGAENSGNSPEDAQAPALSGEADGLPVEKWNAYVDLLNDSELVLDDAQGYFSTFGTAGTPSDEADLASAAWIAPPGATREKLRPLIKNALAQAAQEPSGPLDQKAKVYAEALERCRGLLDEAGTYYAAGKFAMDDFKRGKRLHQLMLDAALAFEMAELDFSAAMKREDHNRQIRNVAELREYGMSFLPSATEFGLAAQDVRDELLRQEITSANLRKLDLEAFAPLYETLAKSLERLELAGDDERMAAEGIKPDSGKKLVSIAVELKEKVAGIMRNAGEEASSDSQTATPEEFYRIMGKYTRQYNLVIS
ncbi:YiiG family protein [Desulfovibrio sp. OttesenSCG-928-C06]|nr:YiiG family protein [Desulfovibrio sp. OttesenSCG-928-C06]